MNKKERLTDEVKSRLDMVGMKYIHDMPYFTELPPGFILCSDFKVFFKLKKHKQKVSKDNLEKIIDFEYLIHSFPTKRYWYRQVWEGTNMRKLKFYFDNQMIYVRQEAKSEDDDALLF
jgi:hypothetical protein